jgi:hypothetical protein
LAAPTLGESQQFGTAPSAYGITIPNLADRASGEWADIGPEVEPVYPEAMFGGAPAAASTVAQVSNAITNNDPTQAYATVGGEAIKQSLEPLATNVGLNAGVAASAIPYIGLAIAPGAAVAAKWATQQTLGTAVDVLTDPTAPVSSINGTSSLTANSIDPTQLTNLSPSGADIPLAPIVVPPP